MRMVGTNALYSVDVKATSNSGNSVAGAYGQHVSPTDDLETARKKIEREVQRHSSRWIWHENGDLSVTHIVPGKLSRWQLLGKKSFTEVSYSGSDS